jgi:ATP-dependent Clp protease ATP-binding subunit ClpB
MATLKSFVRPEFLNRIDETIIFKPLSKDQIVGIVKIQLGHLIKKMDDNNYTLSVSDEAVNFIADSAYDPIYGARPVKRYIQHELENQVAKMIIGDEVHEGDTIEVTVSNGALAFKKK